MASLNAQKRALAEARKIVQFADAIANLSASRADLEERETCRAKIETAARGIIADLASVEEEG